MKTAVWTVGIFLILCHHHALAQTERWASDASAADCQAADAEDDRATVEPGMLFVEGFDDSRLLDRDWYDGEKFDIARAEARNGDGCIAYHWRAGASTPDSSSGMRRLFAPTDSVYLRCFIKLSKGWGWTGKPYHPHLMHFMTTENGKWHGPAASHLTVYIEPWNGKLRLAAQDIQNKDATHRLTQGPLRAVQAEFARHRAGQAQCGRHRTGLVRRQVGY
ncbi:MAG: hypothetical protein HYV60_06425 [Planctomycetia bacterium]|nr:hypothetical protein [Planctomycetia bacterium]